VNLRRLAIFVVVSSVAALAGCALISTGPIAMFDVEPVVIYAGGRVEFDASPSSGRPPLVAYTWDLGDGRTASGKRITTSFQMPGRYTVTLTVEDANGRTDCLADEIIVYLRSGTEVFHEDFSAGEASLGAWPLDPTWASPDDGVVEYIVSTAGYALHIRSGRQSWHRRYATVSLPPLRSGQKIAGSLPYYRFTSDGGGSFVFEPSVYGTDIGHPIGFKPDVYQWHTYSFSYDNDGYEFRVDGTVWRSGSVDADIKDGGDWIILLGEESTDESCNAYYDDISVKIDE